jgi:hypothetical protein
MIGFVARRVLEVTAQLRIARGQSLGRVKGLGAHLSNMVDPHQGSGLALGAGFELGGRQPERRAGSAGARRGEKCAQGTVKSDDNGIHGRASLRGQHRPLGAQEDTN